MRAVTSIKAIYLWIITFVLSSCNKIKLGEPATVSSSSDAAYYIHFKRVNNYNAGSKIVVQSVGYHGSDIRYAYTSVFLEQTLPFADTTFWNISYATNYNLYFKWKILAANNDSLSGGVTPIITLKPNGTENFYINY